MEHAQDLYKKSKKLRRSVAIYNLLLSKIKLHMGYLEEIESSLSTFETYTSYDDILALREISDELDNINEGELGPFCTYSHPFWFVVTIALEFNVNTFSLYINICIYYLLLRLYSCVRQNLFVVCFSLMHLPKCIRFPLVFCSCNVFT